MFFRSPLARGVRRKNEGVHVVPPPNHRLLAQEGQAGHGEQRVPQPLLDHLSPRLEAHEVDRRILA